MINAWSAPSLPLLAGTSVAKTTFTSLADVPEGETSGAFHQIMGGQLQPGSYISVDAWGAIACTGTPTLVLGIYWGLAAGTALAASSAKTLASGLASSGFLIQWRGRVVTNGNAGSIIGHGVLFLPTAVSTFATPTPLPETTPAAVASLDMTVNTKISLGATWSASSASNSVTCHGFNVRIDG